MQIKPKQGARARPDKCIISSSRPRNAGRTRGLFTMSSHGDGASRKKIVPVPCLSINPRYLTRLWIEVGFNGNVVNHRLY